MSYNIQTINQDTDINFSQTLYTIDASNNDITITLPIVTGLAGSFLQVRRTDWISDHKVIVRTNPSDSSVIDGNLKSIVLFPNCGSLLFIDTSDNWNRPLQDTGTIAFFGDGSDGNVLIDSNTTLSRDMYYNRLTISSNAIINMNGFRILVLDRLDLVGSSTTLHNNGSNASGSGDSAGAGGATGSIGGGFAGGAGAIADDDPGNGLPLSSTPGQLGGAGGNGGGIGGGIAGVFTAPTVAGGGRQIIQHPFNALTARDLAATQLTGGTGGGGGIGGATSNGGAGGGGGGLVVICARDIHCPAGQTCFIRALGGAGGNATSSGTAGSGGGGGGGGCVIILTRTPNLILNAPGLALSAANCVSGGAGGSGINGGSSGSSGSIGRLQIIDCI
jgi:hypothetical protein